MSEEQRRGQDGLYRRLLAKGTPAEEIEQVYRRLRDKGYGEQAARARVEREVKRIRDQNRLEERRRDADPDADGSTSARPGTPRPRRGRADRDSLGEGASRRNRRSQDWYPVVSTELRRRVNRWAFKNKLRSVGVRERWKDFLALFRANVPDHVNPRLLRYLAQPSSTKSGNPYEYSLRETLEALRSATGTFLARPGREETARAVSDALRRRDPLAAAYLETFFEISRETRMALRYLELNLQKGRRYTSADLARIAREVYRVSLRTEQVPPAKVSEILALAKDVALAYRAASTTLLDDAEAVLRIAVDNLQAFRVELYPIVLKGIGTFYLPEDNSQNKRSAVLDFVGLNSDEVLDPGMFYEAETKRRERELAEKQKRELEWLEIEKSEDFSQRFAGILSVLSVLFPNSDIENLERMPFLLPYFDGHVYSQRLPFSHHMQDVKAVAASDPGQPLLVLHRIIDDLASSVEPAALEKVTNRKGIEERMHDVLERWQTAYAELFDRYVRELTTYRKGFDDAQYAKTFQNSAMARGLEEEINQLRNLFISEYGHTVGRDARNRGPRLYDLALELKGVLAEVAEDINQDLLTRSDPLGKSIYEALGREHVVDLETHTARTPELKPATRQVKRYIEAKYGTSSAQLPRLSQMFFFDVLRGLADMYAYMTNDPNSFLRAVGDQVVLPGDAEAEAWQRQRELPGSETEERLQIRLSDQLTAEYTDGLTGLKNKTFLLKEVPKEFQSLRSQGKEAAFVMIDIDHFKWINDNLGHQKGDTILQDVSRSLSENSRGAYDRAIRYGGEEFVLVVQAPLHSAVLLAERLRHLQEKRVAASELYEPVRGVQEEKGGVCGTLSIGIVQATEYESPDDAVEAADRALYQAKEARNSVVIETDRTSHELLSYEQYFRTRQRPV
ncbi:MAG: diguanylate cyclase [Spirochaetota bacterium]